MTPEDAFSQFNEALSFVKQIELAKTVPPTLFICGAPRSGTTIAYQCLVHGGNLGCVTNLIARFAVNPVLGVRLTQALDLPNEFSGRSNFGQTQGLMEPHEFGLGWKKILGIDNLEQPVDSSVIDSEASSKIQQFASAWEKPVVFKSFGYLWFIEELSKLIPNSVWLHIHRSPTENARSLMKLYDARKNFGNAGVWQSAVCRKTVAEASGLSLEDRCLRQILDINDHISSQFERIPKDRQFIVSQQAFVEDSQNATRLILEHFKFPIYANRLKEIRSE